MAEKIEFQVPFNKEHNCHCAHTYKILRYVMPHPTGGDIVLGDDKRFHVVSEQCTKGSGFLKPEIILNSK